MKMTKEDFSALAIALKPIKEEHPNAREEYQKAGLSDERYIWDCLHFVMRRGFDIQPLYKYLNDNHIATALKQLLLK